MLRVRDLSKSYPGDDGPAEVLRGVTFDLAAGRTMALTGESGSGKSTALNLIAGLDAPDGGTVEIDGTNLATLDDAGRAALRRDAIGLVFQQFNLIPSLTVAGNLGFQARLKGAEPGTEALAARLGLTEHLAKYPEQLSGGAAAARGDRPGARRAAPPDPRRRAYRQPRRGHRLGRARPHAGARRRDGGGAPDGDALRPARGAHGPPAAPALRALGAARGGGVSGARAGGVRASARPTRPCGGRGGRAQPARGFDRRAWRVAPAVAA